MSAISARVAVVQGRNAIGIELPNQRRETVFLRELLASQDFETSKHKLAIALGKTIGGEPVIVDLAKMPHLLVAGTTGSGKSVAINTMVVSLLYRLKPEKCRLIMVDPKMLELSVYDGIPHLLTPVVTDPEEGGRRAQMGGARDGGPLQEDVEGRRAQHRRLQRARRRSRRQGRDASRRTVQTGFDRETGEADLRAGGDGALRTALYRRRGRRNGRPDDGRRQGHRRRDPAPRADGARGRHPPHHGDPAPFGRRHHRHDQGEFPDPHLVPGDQQDRQPHHPRRAGRRAIARPGRHALHGGRRPHFAASTAPSSPTPKSRRSSPI